MGLWWNGFIKSYLEVYKDKLRVELCSSSSAWKLEKLKNIERWNRKSYLEVYNANESLNPEK